MFYATRVSKNKGIEITLDSNPWCWFKFNIELARKTDHAGFIFSVCLFMKEFHFNFYDSRHWNYETDLWQTYEENTKENKC